MLSSTPSLASQKPEAKNLLRLSFFSLLGLAFTLSTYISLGTSLAFFAFLFKVPKMVEDFPLVRDKGSIYWVKGKRPLMTAWAQKRKRLFEEKGAKVRFSSLDLDGWAAQAFPPGSISLRLKGKLPNFNLLPKSLHLERPLPPSFCIQEAGIFLSQPLILRIGEQLSLPLFAQAFLQPTRKKENLRFEVKGLSLGWIKIPLEKLRIFPLEQLFLEFFYPNNKEVYQLSYLFSQLLDCQIAPGELLLIRKATVTPKVRNR